MTAGKVSLTGVWDWTVIVGPEDEEVMSEKLPKKGKCPTSNLSFLWPLMNIKEKM